MFFSVVKNALVPADMLAHERMAALTLGERVHVEIPHARNQAFSNYFYMLLNRLAQAKLYNCTPRTMRGLVAILTGRCDIIKHKGRAYIIPHGTGPRDMTAAEFEAFAEDAIELIRTEIVPLLDDYDAADIAGLIERPQQ